MEETEEQMVARLERLFKKHNPDAEPLPEQQLPDAPY